MKEVDSMNTEVKAEYKRLDKSKLKTRTRRIISSEESLKDIVLINWRKNIPEDVKKMLVCK